MALELVTVPCLSDNYAYLVHGNGLTALVDAPEAAPIRAELDARGWSLDEIWITHHHGDHIDAVQDLRDLHGARVFGGAADAHRLPPLDVALTAGMSSHLCGTPCNVIDVSGHTIGHLAFHLPSEKLAFTADSLMALGCGRVFEGTKPQMWQSLLKLRALPDDTTICSGHEYTAANARFALTIEPENEALIARADQIAALRDAGQPTVPSRLSLEKLTNPFLRADQPETQAALAMEGADPADVFSEIRTRKDSF